MAPIVNETSDLFRDQLAGGAVPDAAKVKGRTYTATGTVANAADDLSGSMYRLASIPSHALIDPATEFKVDGWGFADIRIGTKDDVDALVSALKSAATTQTPVDKFDANHGLRLWEILGLAADPGGNIDLYAHAIANATGAGSMPFIIAWREQ